MAPSEHLGRSARQRETEVWQGESQRRLDEAQSTIQPPEYYIAVERQARHLQEVLGRLREAGQVEDDLQKQLAEVQAKCTEGDTIRQEVQGELEAARAQCLGLEAGQVQLRAQLTETQEAQTAANRALEEQRGRLREAELRNGELQAHLDEVQRRLDQEHEERGAEILRAEGRVTALHEHYEEQGRSVGAKELRIAELEEARAAAAAELGRFRGVGLEESSSEDLGQLRVTLQGTLQSVDEESRKRLASLEEDRKSFEEEKRQAEEQRLCVVCVNHTKEVVFLPCGHLCMCSGCMEREGGARVRDCPMCRRAIESTVRVYQ